MFNTALVSAIIFMTSLIRFNYGNSYFCTTKGLAYKDSPFMYISETIGINRNDIWDRNYRIQCANKYGGVLG